MAQQNVAIGVTLDVRFYQHADLVERPEIRPRLGNRDLWCRLLPPSRHRVVQMAERPQGPVLTQKPELPAVAFPSLGRQFCDLAQYRRFASLGIAAPASQGEQNLVEFLLMDILSLLSGLHILPGRDIDEISDTTPVERLLLDLLTRMLEPALLPSVPCPNDELQGWNRYGGLIRCHQAGFDDLRLLDQVLQLLLDEL